MEYKLLGSINSPADLKKIDDSQIDVLCDEIRNCLIDTVSKNGGHLASNLGTVELTVALHRVFDAPRDSIIFDVGHQCYTHKLLTGRFDRFSTLRKENGLSGFMRPSESEYDPFTTGHSSNSISAAYGIYKAKALLGEDSTAVAVVGDGALTGGMIYEALNNAGNSKGNFIVVLNDNKMSISRNVGALARYLAIIRSRSNYHKLKSKIAAFLPTIPIIGKRIFHGVFKSKVLLKNAIYHSNIFEGLGFNYLGPVDGHDEKRLEEILKIAKHQTRPSVVHVMTTKGKGYKFAESKPNDYHGVAPFDVETGIDGDMGDCFSTAFGKALCTLAEKDEKICAVTAAMKVSTGLEPFSRLYKNRFFDVGIAEEHAVTFTAGLASGGMRPVFAVYSSFLQRGFDQIIHDAAIENVPITLCVDRAGFVGEDGETHQGLFDAAFLSAIPNVHIYAPANYSELEEMLCKAIYEEGVSVVRYPRGCEPAQLSNKPYSDKNFEVFGSGSTAVVTYGRLFAEISSAKEIFESCTVIKLNRIHPLDCKLIPVLAKCDKVFFFEEGIKTGGIGEQLCQLIADSALSCSYKNIAVEDRFVSPSSVAAQFKKNGLDIETIIKTVKGE